MPNKGFLGPSSQPARLTRILRHRRFSIAYYKCIYKRLFINFLLQRQRSPLPNASVFTQGQLPCHFDEEVGIFKAAERVDENKNTFVRLYGSGACSKMVESETKTAIGALGCFENSDFLVEMARQLALREY